MSQPYKNFDPYAAPADMFAIDAQLSQRLGFLRKVYAHVFGSILLMVGIEVLLFSSGMNIALLQFMGQSWLISLIVFMAVSWFAERLAFSGASAVAQYSGLALYVGLQSLITAPVLTIATLTNPNLIGQAGFITLAITGGLTLFVVFSKSDFSFMRNALCLASLGLLVLAVASAIFGFTLGLGFAVAMVVLMCGYILYQTSAVLHHLPTNAHVAGALMLFSSIVTLFREVLYILMKLNDD